MTKEITFCDRCGKEIPKNQKVKSQFQVMLAPYCDDFKNVISEGRPIDLCVPCNLDLEYFMNSFKSKEGSDTNGNPT